ncbi:MAG: 6-phosphofructokinase [Clostridia bacterium]|nr:6-phosphofructokinase [Clostridia bacterium]
MKRIAVLTSGGDAPGMNAAVRAVVRTAFENEIEVYGVMGGYQGLLESDFISMDLRTVSNIIQRGGTILHSARSEEFKTMEGTLKARDVLEKYGIENVVVIGGDGTLAGGNRLAGTGVSVVGIPATIDNDVGCSDLTIGYDTAMNTVMSMVDRLRDTTEAHKRCSVVEVMGRDAGYIALNSGIAVGAVSILIPEVEYDIQRDVVDRMNRTLHYGKNHFIIIVAEGAGDSEKISKRIKEATGIETRLTVLGHVQRGGSPTVNDRVLGSQFGHEAIQLIKKINDKSSYALGYINKKIVSYPLEEALKIKKPMDMELYKVANEISI